MKDKILVVKNENQILISNNGKRLAIDKDNKLFNLLKDKSKDEIKEWLIKEKRL